MPHAPMAVFGPVETTMPRPLPAATLVPCDGVSQCDCEEKNVETHRENNVQLVLVDDRFGGRNRIGVLQDTHSLTYSRKLNVDLMSTRRMIVLTCQNRLVDAEGGGKNVNETNVGGHLVAN